MLLGEGWSREALASSEAGLERSGFAWDLEDLELDRGVCTLCANHCLLTAALRP